MFDREGTDLAICNRNSTIWVVIRTLNSQLETQNESDNKNYVNSRLETQIFNLTSGQNTLIYNLPM